MHRQISPHARCRSARPVERQRTVCVVDPQADDYRSWRATATAHALELKFVATEDEALRVARTAQVDLWVVNASLPGHGGAELCSMLRAQGCTGPVYLVADEYTAETERAAWDSRATLFVCKPAHHNALAAWLELARHVWPAHSISGPASLTK